MFCMQSQQYRVLDSRRKGETFVVSKESFEDVLQASPHPARSIQTFNGDSKYESCLRIESFTAHSKESSLVKTLKHAATTLRAISTHILTAEYMTHLKLQFPVLIPVNFLRYYLSQICTNTLSSTRSLSKRPLTVFC